MNEDIKKFIRFLKEIGVFMDFLAECKKINLTTIYDTMMYCDTGINDLLLYAFSWDNSIKGGSFWEDVHYRWNDFIKSGKIK